MESKPRTLAQNRALWKMFENLANELNDSGNDMKRTLKPEIDIPWNKNTVCEYLWKPVQKAQLQKESTKELSTTEIDEVFLTLNRYLGTKLGITLEFPSINAIMDRQLLSEQEDLSSDYS